ncbi:MAG: hypothetical protein M1813_002212 [Trichoglossum hirsutum]|nr:MAG: hypothetical protein M1813_002212 [Trichoglossum hirsutum]
MTMLLEHGFGKTFPPPPSEPPPPTNAGGTVVTTLTIPGEVADTEITTVLAYPTKFVFYEYSYVVQGAFQTTAPNGVNSCVVLSGSAKTTIALPSHPPFDGPLPVEIPEGGDDVGTNFEARLGKGPDILHMFPDVGPLISCALGEPAGASTLGTATFLTETSTFLKVSGSPVTPDPGTTKQSVDPETKKQPVTPINDAPSNPPVTFPPDDSSKPSSPIEIKPSSQPSSGSPSPPVLVSPLPTTPPTSVIPTTSPSGQVITPIPTPNHTPASPDTTIHVPAISPQGPVPGDLPTTTPGTQASVPAVPPQMLPPVTLTPAVLSLPWALAVPNPPMVASPLLLLTVGDQIMTSDFATHFIIGTQTLTPGGPAITVSSTPISIMPGATEAVVGTTTVRLYPTPTADRTGSGSPPPHSGGARGFCGQRLAAIVGAMICSFAILHSIP